MLFLAIAFFKQHLPDQSSTDSEAPPVPGTSLSSSSHADKLPLEKHQQDVAEQSTSGKDNNNDAEFIQCQLSAKWIEVLQGQSPVVLQNMTNKAAYNGHVGKIRNCTKSRFLIAVHGVFFHAEPVKIWVKHWHVRLLDKPPLAAKRVDVDRVVVRASSTRGDFPLAAVLEDDDRKWWISKPGSFSQGRGEEYLEFEFASHTVVRVMGISIPPMPMGPLSVREFSVEALVKQQWQAVSPRLQTLDQTGLQEVALQLVDTRRLRVKCFASAAPMDSVGLFQISFF